MSSIVTRVSNNIPESKKCFARAENYIHTAESIDSELSSFLKLKDMYNMANIEEAEHNLTRAEQTLNLALELNKDRAYGRARIVRHKAVILIEKGECHKAIKHLKEIEKVAENFENKLNLAKIKRQLGIAYGRQHNYKQAVRYLKTALKISEKLCYRDDFLWDCFHLFKLYLSLGNGKDADYYRKLAQEILIELEIPGKCPIFEISLH